MKNDTYYAAYEACENYFSDTGQIPTIESIKNIITTNSPNTISTAIKDWKKELAKLSKSPSNNNEDIPVAMLDAVSLIWKQALLEAKKTFDQNLMEIESKQAELAEKETRLAEEKTQAQHLLALSKQQYESEIAILKNEISRLSLVSTKHSEQLNYAQALLIELRKDNAILSTQLNQERENFARLENRYNKEHDWAIKRIEEEKNNYKQSIQGELYRTKAESDKNGKLLEMFQAKYDSASKQLSEYMERIIELERENFAIKKNAKASSKGTTFKKRE